MRKVIKRLVATVIILSLTCGCAPKYTVKYDVSPCEKKLVEFDRNKLGILIFEDARPKIEFEGSSGSTRIMPDKLFELPVPVMVTDLIVMHFDANQGAKGRIVKIPYDTKSVDSDLLDKIKKEGLSEYVLFGSIKHYTANVYDDHYGARMAGTFIAGLTLWGLILMPLILAGDVDINSEIEFDNIMLVKIDGPQILWKGRASNIIKQESALVKANDNKVLSVYGTNTNKTLQSLYNNIMLSYDLGFPQKYSIEDSKKILSYIKLNGSLANLSF